MTCREIEPGVWVCGPRATKELRRVSVGERWCFRCRKRVEFVDICTADVGPSWYDPNWTLECPSGHVDGDLFPGWSRDSA